MSQTGHIDTKHHRDNAQGIRLPIDDLLEYIAEKAERFNSRLKAREVLRFLKFAFVGTLGAIIDLGISFLLLNTIFDAKDNTQFLIAATISFTVAVFSNFFWNRYWTYPDSRSKPIQRQLVFFAIVSTTGWIGRTIWLRFMKPIFTDLAEGIALQLNLPIDASQVALAGGMIAIFIGIFVVMIWNFFVNRYWTFNDVD